MVFMLPSISLMCSALFWLWVVLPMRTSIILVELVDHLDQGIEFYRFPESDVSLLNL